MALSKRKIGNDVYAESKYGWLWPWYGPDDDAFEPTLEDYKVIFEAWGKGR